TATSPAFTYAEPSCGSEAFNPSEDLNSVQALVEADLSTPDGFGSLGVGRKIDASVAAPLRVGIEDGPGVEEPRHSRWRYHCSSTWFYGRPRGAGFFWQFLNPRAYGAQILTVDSYRQVREEPAGM
ncbi:hypothetical protein ACIBI9_67915, partial [Nonomuraea sp. NPDC050451]|uniref:hypothetical protein n=1 Tax=Nonomuraea sp. NPDC050451 TaxID=3364364 RepID=UPI00378D136B